MSNGTTRAGLRLMIFSVAASYILTLIQRSQLRLLADEHFYAAQTVLLITAWVSGLMATGGCIFSPSRYKGICGFISKLAGTAASAGLTLAAVWAVARLGGADAACNFLLFHLK